MPDGNLALFADRLEWQSKKKDATVSVYKQDLKSLHWSRASVLNEITAVLRAGGTVRFQGLQDKDHDAIAAWCKDNLGVSLEKMDVSLSGRNWGSLELRGTDLVMQDDQKRLMMSLPLAEVSQSLQQGRNEVSLEFHKTAEVNAMTHTLSEVRFFIPGEATVEVVGQEEPVKGAEAFHALVVDKTELSATGDIIAQFEGLRFVVPRSNLRVDLCEGFMRLHGKTHQHRIEYSHIQKMMCVAPSETSDTLSLVMFLNPPIRQGKSAYPVLVAELDREDRIDDDDPVKINLTEDEIASRFPGTNLHPEMRGDLWEVLVSVIKAITGKKVVGSGAFSAPGNVKALECSFRSSAGHLYPLERSFLYLTKPPQMFAHKDIALVRFVRGEAMAKTLDIEIELVGQKGKMEFKQISKDAKDALIQYLEAKDVQFEDVSEDAKASKDKGAMDASMLEDEEDEEDDDDFAGSASDSEDDNDFVDDASGDEEVTKAASKSSSGKDKSKDKADKEKEKEKPKEKERPKEAPKSKPSKGKKRDESEEEEEEEEESEDERPKKKSKK
jgi:structure-specific recognition protein 1